MNDPISLFAALVIVAIFGGVICALGVVLWLQMNRIDELLKHQNKPKPKRKRGRSPALSESDLDDIVKLLDAGHTKTEIANIFDVSRQTLYTALARRTDGKG